MTTLGHHNPIDGRTDLVLRLALAAAAVMAAVLLDSSRGGTLFLLLFLFFTRQPRARRASLLVGSAYVLAVLFAPLLPFANTVSVVALFGAFNVLVGLATSVGAVHKTAALLFTVGNLVQFAVGLLLGLNNVPISIAREGFLYCFVLFSFFLVAAYYREVPQQGTVR